MAIRLPSISWIYNNRRWLAALAAATILGIVAGILLEGGRFLPLLGSAVGAMLGTIGGVFGGLIVQRQRVSDEQVPDAVTILLACEAIQEWLHDPDCLDLQKFESNLLVWELEKQVPKIAPAPRLGVDLNRRIHSMERAGRALIEGHQGLKKEPQKGLHSLNWDVYSLKMKTDLPILIQRLKTIVGDRA